MLQKRSYEERLMKVDLGPALSGDIIASVASVTAHSGITISDTGFNDDTVQFLAKGGTDGTDYIVTIRVATVGPPVQKLEAVINLKVADSDPE